MKRCVVPVAAWAVIVGLGCAVFRAEAQGSTQGTGSGGVLASSVDFNRDGVPETLVNEPGKTLLRKPDGRPADFQFPAGVSVLDARGGDAGLRRIDLNGDGFDDLLQSNPEGYAIHLWNRNVQPHLGWTLGWSQFVRSGPRTGAPDEPPSLVGAAVRLKGGFLVVDRPPVAGGPASR
ncbi:MAG: FG-GAP repeat domain-containing protein, partial [Verrucomicrobiota bacterium]